MPAAQMPPLQDGRPVMTVGQRRSQIEETRYIDIRNLAYMAYKKPDGTPLMRYEETLGTDRDQVKNAVLHHEVISGWLIPDGSEGAVQIPPQPLPQPQITQPQPQGAVMNMPFSPNGAPPQVPQQQPMQPPPQQQAMPFQPGPPAPFGQPMAPPPGMQMQPPSGTAQQFPPPQMVMQPPMPQQPVYQAPPPPVSPQQAAAAAAPAPQEAPAQAPTGRKRASKASGTAVAPPPPAPPPAPMMGQPVQQFAPPQGAPAPFNPGVPQPQQFQPQAAGAPFQPAMPMAPPPPQAAPAAPSVDLSAVIGRLDNIGQGLGQIATQTKILTDALEEQKRVNAYLLTCLHHLYLSNPQLAQGDALNAKTLNDFLNFLNKFTGTPR